MARTKDESLHQERRLQILSAAAGVFKTKGFHAARTTEICVAAGLSAGTVFRYFESKDDIIAAIVEMEMDGYRDQIEQLATKEGLQSFTQLTVNELTALFAPSPFYLGTDSWLELFRNPKYRDTMQKQDLKLRRTLASALKRGQREAWVRPGLDPVGAANIIIALFSGLMFDAESNPKLHTNATANALADLFQHFILNNPTFS